VTNQEPVQPAEAIPPDRDGGQIRVTEGILGGVIIPIATLLIIFIAVLYGTPHLAACDDYYIIKLVYPFLFGALGVVLGGSIVITGQLPLLGERSRMRAAGGIAGALLGFAIAQFSQPSECEAKHSIILKGFPASGSVPVVYNGMNKKRE